MEVYLDNSATTKCSKRAAEVMKKAYFEDYGNTSSLHLKGMQAEQYIKDAREKIAKILKVEPKELIFTSGGTESDNLAIIGCALANKRGGNHLITTKIEHAAVGNTMKFMEEQGFRVTYLDVDENGIISLEELKEAVCEETILVSIMGVNNEIGAIEPLEEAAKIIKEKNPNTLFHVDGVQAFGKIPLYPKKIGIDLLSVSGHKLHGPKGVGFLYVKNKTKIKPIIFGGGHQNGMRSGTENVPGVAGMAEAISELFEEFQANIDHMYALKEVFEKGIQEIEGTTINGKTGRDSAPQIVSVSFDQVRSEVLLHTLEEKGIYVSGGSACSSNKPQISKTLLAIGVKKELLDSTIRFSFCPETTMEEIEYTLEALRQVLPMLRKFTRH